MPHVVQATDHVLVTEWMDGTPLSKIIAEGTPEERNRAGILLVRFLFSGPARAGLLHADPHPGNFRLLADGRLGVLDFGAVDRLPDGLPPFFGKLLRLMHEDGDIERWSTSSGCRVSSGRASAWTSTRCTPSWPRWPSRPGWTRSSSAGSGCARRRPGSPTCVVRLGRRLNLPPSYVLIHRVSTEGSACSASSGRGAVPRRADQVDAGLRHGSGGARPVRAGRQHSGRHCRAGRKRAR